MKMITLDNVVDSLEKMQYPIELEEEVRVAAAKSLERMLELSR
jgi:quinolinate synthase